MLSSPGARRTFVRYRDVPGPDEGMAGGARRNPVSLDAGCRACFCRPHRAHDSGQEFGAVGAVGSVLGEIDTASECAIHKRQYAPGGGGWGTGGGEGAAGGNKGRKPGNQRSPWSPQ